LKISEYVLVHNFTGMTPNWAHGTFDIDGHVRTTVNPKLDDDVKNLNCTARYASSGVAQP